MTRAKVRGRGIQRDRIAPYLPSNYSVTGAGADEQGPYVLIEGEDNLGWSFDLYVQPRLASGQWFAERDEAEDPEGGQR